MVAVGIGSTWPRQLLAGALCSVMVCFATTSFAQPAADADDSVAGDAASKDAGSNDAASKDAAKKSRRKKKKKKKRKGRDTPAGLTKKQARTYRRLSRPAGSYARLLAGVSFGGGFRFNNPYRLATPLGESAESVSLTSPYVDVAGAALFGAADGVQHGGSLRLSVALSGVAQEAVSLSYMLAYRADTPWLFYGRLGASLLTRPQVNVGGELAAGAAYYVTGGLGLTAEAVGNLFYGAGSYEVEFTTIPMLSFSAGVLVDYEVLP